jgi:hypothetical protein
VEEGGEIRVKGARVEQFMSLLQILHIDIFVSIVMMMMMIFSYIRIGSYAHIFHKFITDIIKA